MRRAARRRALRQRSRGPLVPEGDRTRPTTTGALLFRLEGSRHRLRLPSDPAPAPRRVELSSTSGVICVEMMRKFQEAGARFAEVGVSHYSRPHGRSQFFRIPAIARSARQLFVLWWALIVARTRLATPTIDPSIARWWVASAPCPRRDPAHDRARHRRRRVHRLAHRARAARRRPRRRRARLAGARAGRRRARRAARRRRHPRRDARRAGVRATTASRRSSTSPPTSPSASRCSARQVLAQQRRRHRRRWSKRRCAPASRDVVFSSSCSVYGTPAEVPGRRVGADRARERVRRDKAMVERILHWYGVTHGLRSV